MQLQHEDHLKSVQHHVRVVVLGAPDDGGEGGAGGGVAPPDEGAQLGDGGGVLGQLQGAGGALQQPGEGGLGAEHPGAGDTAVLSRYQH